MSRGCGKSVGMKLYRVLHLCLFLVTINCGMQAQVRQSAEIMPQFEGSVDGLKKWLAQNMNYPQEAIQKKEEGRVVVKFVITENGSVTQPIVTTSVSPSLDNEAIRLVSQMPKWIPASQNGQPCSIEYTLPIRFKLPEPQQQNNTVAQSTNNRSKTDLWEQIPNHKTYEGPFEAFGLFDNYGKAKYQYIENYDGTRIFDGRFEYQAEGFVVKGQFLNDYQIGEWVFIGKDKTSVINFSDNGRPHGHFELFDFHCEFIKYEDNSSKARIVMTKNKFSGELVNGDFSRIEFTTPKNYHPVIFYSQGECTEAYMEGAKNIKYDVWSGWYRIDDMTGDKVHVSDHAIGYKTDFGSFSSDVLSTAKLRLKQYLLRSTKRKYGKYY